MTKTERALRKRLKEAVETAEIAEKEVARYSRWIADKAKWFEELIKKGHAPCPVYLLKEAAKVLARNGDGWRI